MGDFIDAPRSVKFWNIVALMAYGFSYLFIGLPLFILLSVVLSIVGIIVLAHDNTENHFWPLGTPLMLLILIVCLIMIGLGKFFEWVYERTIQRFNDWLDGTNKKIMVPFEDNEP